MPHLIQYYDIHTHSTASQGDCFSIRNIHQNFSDINSTMPCSVGLHPWYPDTFADGKSALIQAATLPSVMAIGECGLDKLCDTDWSLQLTVFEQQIRLAQRIRKPIIIHCVRAFDEVLATLKNNKITVPVVFHGFNKKQELAGKLLQQGYYLSFGAAILKPLSPAASTLANTPTDRYFLETDDSDVCISDLYLHAASVRGVQLTTVVANIASTFKKVF